jgi:hypothetical protein
LIRKGQRKRLKVGKHILLSPVKALNKVEWLRNRRKSCHNMKNQLQCAHLALGRFYKSIVPEKVYRENDSDLFTEMIEFILKFETII